MTRFADDGRPCLMQRKLKHDTWKLLIGCLMFNRTDRKQAYIALDKLFDVADTPFKMLNIDAFQLQTILHPCGLWRKRAIAIKQITEDYIAGRDVPQIRNCGKYAMDSYDIFVRGITPPFVTDKELQKYLQEQLTDEQPEPEYDVELLLMEIESLRRKLDEIKTIVANAENDSSASTIRRIKGVLK